MKRAYYSETISGFLYAAAENILGKLAENSTFALETTQRDAWMEQIRILKEVALRNNLWVKIMGIAFGDADLCFSNTPQPKPDF